MCNEHTKAEFKYYKYQACVSHHQECSMDIRKEMSRSIFLAGGVTQLPGLVDRLTTELDNLTPPAIRPKVRRVGSYSIHIDLVLTIKMLKVYGIFLLHVVMLIYTHSSNLHLPFQLICTHELCTHVCPKNLNII